MWAGTLLRALVPLLPRPAVLPLEPSPRPTRVRAVLEPGAGRRWCTFSGRSRRSVASVCFAVLFAMSVHFLDGDQVRHRVDHAPDLGPVLLDDHVAQALEAQAAQGVPLVLLATDAGAGLGDLQPRHQDPTPARALSSAAGATSSRARPRRAATSSGRSRPCRAATVACTMLIGFDDPRDLESTSWMPAHSSTARTGPPAITPVPGEAGFSMTTPAAFSPWMGCGMVPWMRGTLKKCFLASSTPLAIAAGTSLALP